MEKYCPVLMLIILKNKESPNGFDLFNYVKSKPITYLRKATSSDVFSYPCFRLSFSYPCYRLLQEICKAGILLVVLQRPNL